jgi:hypothetical protein
MASIRSAVHNLWVAFAAELHTDPQSKQLVSRCLQVVVPANRLRLSEKHHLNSWYLGLYNLPSTDLGHKVPCLVCSGVAHAWQIPVSRVLEHLAEPGSGVQTESGVCCAEDATHPNATDSLSQVYGAVRKGIRIPTQPIPLSEEAAAREWRP